MGRIARSWRLFKQSWAVLMADKELMLLPVLSGLAILLVVLSYALPVGLLTGFDRLDAMDDGVQVALGVSLYIVTFTVAFFFQAAVIAGALERMSGGDPTVRSALSAARKRIGAIILWGIVAGTVGWIIKALQDRSEWVGKIVMGIVGVAWALATFFMAPVIIMEGSGLRASFSRSWSLFKQTWGETVVGSGGIGLVSFVGMLVLALPVYLLAAAGLGIVAAVIGVAGVLGLMVLTSTLQGVYVAALYRYATTGESPTGYDSDTLAGAFINKKKLGKVFE